MEDRAASPWIIDVTDRDFEAEVIERSQQVPVVVGVRAGALAGQFVGAQPESGVRAFLAELLPSPGERLAADGTALLAAGKTSAAEAAFRQALELDARATVALIGLAAIHSQ